MRASSGQVSTPRRAEGSFFVWLNTQQSLPHNQSTQINFDSKRFDVSGWANTTGTTGNDGTRGRFNPQLPGIYRFNAYVTVNTGGLSFLQLWKNGANYAELGADGSIQRVEGTILVQMNGTTDYVDIRFYQFINSTITSATGSGNVYFCGEYIGAE